MTQWAMEIRKISDMRETPAPSGQSWWEIDGTRYVWRQGAPYVRITGSRPDSGLPDEILPLDTPTKAAAKRAVFQHIWPERR